MVCQRLKTMNNKVNCPLHSLWASVSMGFQKRFGRGKNRIEVKGERGGEDQKKEGGYAPTTPLVRHSPQERHATECSRLN